MPHCGRASCHADTKSDVVAHTQEIRRNQGFKSIIPVMDGKVRDTNRYVKEPLSTEGRNITGVTFWRSDLRAVGIFCI
jgi:hypothetical protein